MALTPGRAARTEPASLRVLPGGRRRPTRAALVPAATLLVLAIFGAVALQAVLSQDGFRAAKLESQLREAEERHALLRAEVASLSSPSRLEKEAAGLGMSAPDDPVYVRTPDLGGPREAHTPSHDYSSKRLLYGGP